MSKKSRGTPTRSNPRTRREENLSRKGTPRPDQIHERVNVAPTPPKKQDTSGEQGGSGGQQTTTTNPESGTGDSGSGESSKK